VYYLKANTEYEIHFEHISKVEGSIYSDHCHTFKLNVEFASKTILEKLSRESCPEHIPTRDEVIMERLIGVKDSLYRYGTKTILQLFSYKTVYSKNIGDDYMTQVHPKSIYFI